MKGLRFPIHSALLSEARLYALESSGHTLDYEGWGDQYEKMGRLTYGKFGQLWVTEFCRANGIDCVKDISSPYVPDKVDLTIYGHAIDVKTTVNRSLLGQTSPGVFQKNACDFFCFLVTDKKCSFVETIGFLDAETYKSIAVKVKKGELIPGTTWEQRFSESYFLPPDAPVVPFMNFLLKLKTAAHTSRLAIRAPA